MTSSDHDVRQYVARHPRNPIGGLECVMRALEWTGFPMPSSNNVTLAFVRTYMHKQSLIDVSEVEVLLVRHITERRRIQIPSLQSTFHLALQTVSALVLPRQDESQGQDQAHLDQV